MAIATRGRDGARARCAVLGSGGGGGTTTMVELMLAGDGRRTMTLAEVDEVDPGTPCFGTAFVGSTILLGERMPDLAPFAHLVAAAERWLGVDLSDPETRLAVHLVRRAVLAPASAAADATARREHGILGR